MADSSFWRDLAAQFRALPYPDMLRADGQYFVGSGSPWNWRLRGGPNNFTDSAFEVLARRGASEIASAGATDLLVFWLEELRKGKFNFRFSSIATDFDTDGTDGQQYLMGHIYAVCEASATFCKKLEAEAVQAEFEEKKRNDPQNWSPSEQSTRIDPTTLRDSYLAKFPDEKIKIRDLCWAAGQHYREWKRWLAGELKDGSTPDLAFRRVLTSGKKPRDSDKKPRPKGWE